MFDVLIIGQGIAGSCLAYQLLQNGFSVAIIDNGHKQSASKISAGFMQHVFGKFMTMNPLIEECFDYSIRFYQDLEKEFNQSFIQCLDVQRILNDTQVNIWNKKKHIKPYDHFLSESLSSEKTTIIKHNAVVDSTLLLTCFRDFFKSNHILYSSEFASEKISVHNDFIDYESLKAKQLIFCTGSLLSDNPYLTGLPFANVKGDTLTIELQDKQFRNAYQKDYCFVPHSHTFRVGANYDKTLCLAPTKTGYDLLTQFINDLPIPAYNVLCQHSGIRCVLADNLPIMGIHPKNNKLGFFGALSSRGFITAPYLSHIWSKTFPLHNRQELSLSRFAL
jgi:glycine oxidase